MELQNATIAKFKKYFKNPTLREIAALTGIKLTRVHRILNGKVMKLDEYVAFQKAMTDKEFLSKNFEKLSFECLTQLPFRELYDLELVMTRKLRTLDYRNELS